MGRVLHYRAVLRKVAWPLGHAQDSLPSKENNLSQECPCLSISVTLSHWLGAVQEAWHRCQGCDGFQKAVPGDEAQLCPLQSQTWPGGGGGGGVNLACFVLINLLSGTNCRRSYLSVLPSKLLVVCGITLSASKSQQCHQVANCLGFQKMAYPCLGYRAAY